MRDLNIKVKTFDLKAFEQEIVGFLEKTGLKRDPYDLITVEDSCKNEFEVPDRDIVRELLEGTRTLFFPFSKSSGYGQVECANGQKYYVPDGDEDDFLDNDDDDLLDDDIDDLLDDNYAFHLTAASKVGFLVKKKQSRLIFKSAKYAAETGSVRILQDCGILDKPMEHFLHKFIL